MALEILEEDSTQAAHVALPCGTGSRARDIPLPAWKSQRHLGIRDPGPLRSETEPWGITGIGDPIDQARLDSANKLIRFILKVAAVCRRRGILCIVENPWRSLLWFIPELWDLVSDWADFSACMTGGARDKRQRQSCRAWLAGCSPSQSPPGRLPGQMVQRLTPAASPARAPRSLG